MRFPFVFAACVIAAPAMAQSRPHLCKSGEEAAFACASGSKIVSLCASQGLNETSGYLQYRFGTRRNIELVYPAGTTTPPRDAFEAGVTGGTAGGADFLQFSLGGARYTLYSNYYRGRESDGLVVERGGKRVMSLRCRGAAVDTLKGWSVIYRAKLPQAPPDFEVP